MVWGSLKVSSLRSHMTKKFLLLHYKSLFLDKPLFTGTYELWEIVFVTQACKIWNFCSSDKPIFGLSDVCLILRRLCDRAMFRRFSISVCMCTSQTHRSWINQYSEMESLLIFRFLQAWVQRASLPYYSFLSLCIARMWWERYSRRSTLWLDENDLHESQTKLTCPTPRRQRWNPFVITLFSR